MTLLESLKHHQAHARLKQAELGGNNEFFAGYLMAIGHAIELVNLQQSIEINPVIRQKTSRR
jgi:hypothetical protein